MEIESTTIPSPLPPYLPPKKPNAKPIRDSKDVKCGAFTPLILEKIPFEGELLRTIPQWNFKDNNFKDQKKYP